MLRPVAGASLHADTRRPETAEQLRREVSSRQGYEHAEEYVGAIDLMGSRGAHESSGSGSARYHEPAVRRWQRYVAEASRLSSSVDAQLVRQVTATLATDGAGASASALPSLASIRYKALRDYYRAAAPSAPVAAAPQRKPQSRAHRQALR